MKSHSTFWTAIRSATLGLLVAASGIGGSDVSMAALTGSRFGLMLLWAIIAGAFIKFILNEGVARWQIATGETFLEGACHRFGPLARIAILAFLIPWTLAVGASLMSACATVTTAILAGKSGWSDAAPSTPTSTLVLLGLAHSIAAAMLVFLGGYKIFKRVMGVLTITMVLLVVIAAILTRPDLAEFARGLFVPSLPLSDPQGIQWTIALAGGIGGTVTMLAYGYWMREDAATEFANSPSTNRWSHRADLAIAYTVTAVFGIALTVLSANVPVHASGSNLFHAIASRLDTAINPIAGWAYLAGAWCAVSACMLGVWQFTPLLFTDLISFGRSAPSKTPDSQSPTYRAYLIGLATIPALGIWFNFADVQRGFGIISALFVPLLAAALLLMNNRRVWVGKHANGWFTNTALVAALAVAVWYLANEVSKLLAP